MKFVVMTQYLENYGAHCEDGKFANGNAYWKFKGGDDYLVEGLERPQDAMAFVASIAMGYPVFENGDYIYRGNDVQDIANTVLVLEARLSMLTAPVSTGKFIFY